MSATTRTRIYLLLAACIASTLGWAGWANAQISPPAGEIAFPRIARSEDREQLYRESRSELDAFVQQSAVMRKVVRLVRPAVVHIEARKSEMGDGEQMFDEAGAGVLVDYQGTPYILTNRHVVLHAPLNQINLKLADGRQLHPIGFLSDPETDVAVLEVDIRPVATAKIGDSGNLEIGDYVMAMGSPFGLCHSVTHGIVSAKGRRDFGAGN